MRYFGAYLLAVLGGNQSPGVSDVKKILESCNISCSDQKILELIEKLKGKDLNELVAQGFQKLGGMPFGGSLSGSIATEPQIAVNIREINFNYVINATAYLISCYSGNQNPDEKMMHSIQKSVGSGSQSRFASGFANQLKDRDISQLIAVGRTLLAAEESKPPPQQQPEQPVQSQGTRSYHYDDDDQDDGFDSGGMSLFD